MTGIDDCHSTGRDCPKRTVAPRLCTMEPLARNPGRDGHEVAAYGHGGFWNQPDGGRSSGSAARGPDDGRAADGGGAEAAGALLVDDTQPGLPRVTRARPGRIRE